MVEFKCILATKFEIRQMKKTDDVNNKTARSERVANLAIEQCAHYEQQFDDHE